MTQSLSKLVFAFTFALSLSPLSGSRASAAEPAAGHGHGQGHGGPHGMWMKACGDDMKKLCGDVKYGDHEGMMKCMKSNEDKLSGSCKAQRDQMKAKMEEYRAACQSDIDKLCKDHKGDPRAVHECLKQNESKLSDSCKAVGAKMKAAHEAHHVGNE